ncbi:uncharacterized protein LOC116788649 isoform X2 [Chiroxiphia lanceolata]|uniref:uncharacterized protein LOC116788649 isoform X2 n=1 Tax=Chiroxiphia lanceolata TaxID=296741 RepID=UPI0013CE622D|nr:uncharacterized protein LOC116788649 isoform X2 [Chiroxiphia lanceolata]
MLFARSVSVSRLARGFPWCGGELCFLRGERRASGSCSMTPSCAEPGSLSRMSSATMSLRSPFLLLGEHEVDGEDPQASAGTRDSYSCDFPTALVRGTSWVPWGITPVSSKVLTEVAAAVVPVVWASGTPGEWKRAEPVGITPTVGSVLVRPSQYPLKSECQLGLVAVRAEFAPPGFLVEGECKNLPSKPMAKVIDECRT